MIKGRKEICVSIDICPKNKFLFCQLVLKDKSNTQFVSRFLLFEIQTQKIVLKAARDLFTMRLHYFLGSKNFYIGKKLLVLSLTKKDESCISVLKIDLEMESIIFMPKKQIRAQEDQPVRFEKLNDDYYYTGECGKIFKLDLVIPPLFNA